MILFDSRHEVIFNFSVVQGPRSTCGPPQRCQWAAEACRKNFKSEVWWKPHTFVSVNYLCWIWIAFAQEQYLFCVPFCFNY